MLHAAALFAGIFALWVALTGRVASAADLAMAAGAAATCVAIAAWVSGVRGNAFASAPQRMLLAAGRAGAVLRGAVSTIRAALAADITLNPALVRIKTRSRSASAIAFANMISAAPGSVVVEAELDSVLVHVIDEERAIAALGVGAGV
jgi:multisubunit Na+/H+ antiporter MnhE subunit